MENEKINADDVLEGLTQEERLALQVILDDVQGKGQSDILSTMMDLDFEFALPDMETFLLDPYFMGETGRMIYPKLIDDLVEVFEGSYYEIHLAGGIGWGKSTVAEFIMARMIAECWSRREPASAFGLMPGTTISFVNISVSEAQARRVIFKGLYQKLARSPFFREHCRPDPTVVSELRFPKNIWMAPVASTDKSVLGLDIHSGIMDETNFMSVVEKSKSMGRGGKRFDLAETIFHGMMSRMKSRYISAGTIPGKLILVSSKTYPDTFMEKRIQEAREREEKGVFIREYSTWGPKPAGTYSGRKFYIEVGDMARMSRVISEDEAKKAFGRVEKVPIEFLPEFERDTDQAVRDLLGVATATINPYIKDFSKVMLAIDGREHPFTAEVTNLVDEASFIETKMVTLDKMTSKKEPILNPESPRWVHVDPSISGDATGLAMGHIAGLIEVTKRSEDTDTWIVDEAPLYVMDFMIRIIPPIGDEISFSGVRELVYQLKNLGYPIKGVSYDSRLLSAETLQHYRSRGYQTELISVEKETEYNILKTAFYEKRVRMYHYKPVLEELRRLEADPKSKKVDHPTGGCFVGETRIPLLDGTMPMIKDLVGKEFWVYSCKPDGKIVPGKARGKETKKTREFVDVVLDSGAVERCTPDHLWMLRDGSYRQAKDLRPGINRLMPINRTWPVNGGYERLTNKDKVRILTHWMVLGGDSVIGNNECVHHINGNKLDNRPENLVIVNKSDHAREHTIRRYREDNEYKNKVISGLQRFNLSERGRKIHSDAIKKTVQNMSGDKLVSRARNRDNFRSDVTLAEVIMAYKDGAENPNQAAGMLNCGRNVIIRVMRDSGIESWGEFVEKEKGVNHKVRAIIPVELDDQIPVYDLEVDEFNNFALCSGVFVHNSKDTADAVCGVVVGLSRYLTIKSRGKVSVTVL